MLAHQGACCFKISPGGGLWRAQSGGEFAVHNSRQRRACFEGLVTAVLARGGGESARAKGGGWERVAEDGEVVVGWPTMCAGSGKPVAKSEDDAREGAYIRSRPAHPRKGWSSAPRQAVRIPPALASRNPRARKRDLSRHTRAHQPLHA